jgi:hypothetical protein
MKASCHEMGKAKGAVVAIVSWMCGSLLERLVEGYGLPTRFTLCGHHPPSGGAVIQMRHYSERGIVVPGLGC